MSYADLRPIVMNKTLYFNDVFADARECLAAEVSLSGDILHHCRKHSLDIAVFDGRIPIGKYAVKMLYGVESGIGVAVAEMLGLFCNDIIPF